MESNVIGWKQIISSDVDLWGYVWQTENIPVGEYEAVMDFKVWAKNVTGIHCYFRIVESDKLIKLTLFRLKDSSYRLDNGKVDFRNCPIGAIYWIKTALNGKGNICLQECSLLPSN